MHGNINGITGRAMYFSMMDKVEKDKSKYVIEEVYPGQVVCVICLASQSRL